MLRVWVDNRPVGVLDRWGGGGRGSTFVYDARARPEDAVSLTMPKRTDSWNAHHGLLPVFDMNLPEGTLRAKLRLAFAKATGSFDDFDLLAVVGRSQVGRIRFTGLDDALDEDVPFQDIDAILRARRGGELFDYLVSAFASHSGLAGVQPKVMVRGTPDGDGFDPRDRYAPSVRGATHIVKLWDPREYPELAANEFFCLMAAKEAGLPVPAFELSDDGAALVVERFDRREGGGYLGFEDFGVLNGEQTENKYKGGYEGRLFKRIKDFVSPAERGPALEQAFRTFVLNCAVRNGDAHMKNFGVLYRDAESPVSLAPVFDVVTTQAYVPGDAMALTLDGTTRWPDRKALVRLGTTRADLRPARAAEILEQVADAVSDVSRNLESWFAQSAFPETGARILEAWSAGLASLGLERTMASGERLASDNSQNEGIKPK